MANEITVTSSLNIQKSNLLYRRSSNFRSSMTGTKGPTPGAVAISVAGVSVNFTELTTPGICVIRNLDATNFIEYGIFDGTEFYPLGEILPGEEYGLRLSRNLKKSFTGTATTDTTDLFRLRANIAPCNVSIEAFEA